MIFFWKIVPYWVYFGQGEDLKLTVVSLAAVPPKVTLRDIQKTAARETKLTAELSEKVQYSHNQTIKNGLNEAILLMQIKKSFTVKKKFCVFQVTRT